MTHPFNPCVIVPVYNHGKTVTQVVEAILAHGVGCILVNDGSDFYSSDILSRIIDNSKRNVLLLEHRVNLGKGAAVITGLRRAASMGFTHALQIDADGQHDTNDIPRFLEYAKNHPEAVIAGYPIYDKSVPKARLYGRYLTHIWVWINTLSTKIKDSMCGFRVYPLAATMKLLNHYRIGKRMDFDTDIIVRLFWEGVPVNSLPTRVHYYPDTISHFHIVRDNLSISKMHARHFFGMLIRLPKLIARKFKAS